MESTPFSGIFQAARNEIAACGYSVLCGRQEVWRVQPSIADEVRNSPGTGTVHKCALVTKGLSRIHGFLRMFCNFPSSWQMRKRDKKCFYFLAGHSGNCRKDTF